MLRQLGISQVTEQLNPEFPRIRNLRCDLLLRTGDGELHQLELQARNETNMAQRMLDYAVAALHCYGQCPVQTVLYVGDAPMRMQSRLLTASIDFRFTLLDIRDLDRGALLRSGNIADNLIAILAGRREDGAIRRILGKMEKLKVEERDESIRLLLVLCGLRGWESRIEEEVDRMPLNIDIMQNKVLGPAIRRGIEEGHKKGLEEGIEQGIERGIEQGLEKGLEQGIEQAYRDILRLQIETRFGPIPGWAHRKLRKLSHARAQGLAAALLWP